jgi:hypothetical protein
MARNNSSKTTRTAPQAQGQPQTAGDAGAGNVGDGIEQQVVAFAEQLGRVVGTVQAKAEGWLDPKALSDQVARVRDSAASLLQQIGAPAEQKAEPATSGGSGRASIATIDRGRKAGGRSGGVVDAPGKKHRKPVPNEPARASHAADRGRVAKMKAVNAHRKRGR